MRIVLVSTIVLLCSFSAPARAKVATKVVGNATQSSSSWSSWMDYLRPPSKQEFEKEMEQQWKQLEQDVAYHSAKLQQHVKEIHESAQATLSEMEQDVKKTEQILKRMVEKDILKQRQGWQRFRMSVRDHIGLLLGATMSFVGTVCLSPTTCSGLQAGQLTWYSLHKTNITRNVFDPWLKDVMAASVAVGVVATSTSKSGDGKSSIGPPSFYETVLPLASVAVAISRSVGIVSDYFEDEVNPITRTVLQVVASGVGTAVLYASPLPLHLVATSVAGAILVYQSVISEVTGNWFYMLENMSTEKRRSIRQAIYRKMQKKLLFPVESALEQVRAALYNETLALKSTQKKVADAIHSSFQVRLVWTCASVGIVYQMLLHRPLTQTVEHLWSKLNKRRREETTPVN